MKPILTAIVLAALSQNAAAQGTTQQGVPTINIDPSCRAASSGTIGMNQDYDSCRRSENAARELLVQQWTSFNAADRRSCHSLTTTGTPGTYTELLTCLEMKRDARNLPYDSGTIGLGTRSR